jgi:hypothetical protein
MKGMQHFTGGVEIRREIIYTKESKRGQQADLPYAVDVSFFFALARRDSKRKKDDDN